MSGPGLDRFGKANGPQTHRGKTGGQAPHPAKSFLKDLCCQNGKYLKYSCPGHGSAPVTISGQLGSPGFQNVSARNAGRMFWQRWSEMVDGRAQGKKKKNAQIAEKERKGDLE